jgi:hypothetical protein
MIVKKFRVIAKQISYFFHKILTVHVSHKAAVLHKKKLFWTQKINDDENELDVLSFCNNASEISSKSVCFPV